MARKLFGQYAQLLGTSKREKDLISQPKGLGAVSGMVLGGGLAALPMAFGVPSAVLIPAAAAAGGAIGGAVDSAVEGDRARQITDIAESREKLQALLTQEAEDEEIRRAAITSLARKYQQYL
jgi:outer membrane lipoprotein SlyB